jgi:hypothetical protein
MVTIINLNGIRVGSSVQVKQIYVGTVPNGLHNTVTQGNSVSHCQITPLFDIFTFGAVKD